MMVIGVDTKRAPTQAGLRFISAWKASAMDFELRA
jgi:hypothetical protein